MHEEMVMGAFIAAQRAAQALGAREASGQDPGSILKK